jgi:hypothetical protein
MKKIFLILLFFGSISYGQTKGISYQALILDPVVQELPGFNNNQVPLANKTICLKFSIIDELDALEYEEIFTTTTDDVGMVNLIIGTGTSTGGYASSFEGILWSTLAKNLKVNLSLDEGCSNFTEISNAPFTAVPFALFAINTQDTPLGLDNEAELRLLRSLLAATQIGAGLNTDGTYTPDASTSYIRRVTSLKEADTALDSEVKNNENAINTKVSISAIVNNLTTGGAVVPLSAEQGKVLKNLVDTSVNIVVEDNLTSTSTTDALSANQGRALKGLTETNTTDIATNTSAIAANVTDIADLETSKLERVNDLSDLADTATARTNLGLGTIATTNATDYATSAQGATADTALQTASNLSDLTDTVTSRTNLGLGNVDNTTDLLKPVSTAALTKLNLKANLASPTFTGTVAGITSTMVGLANADNTTDLLKPVSTATLTELNLKANLASPTFTGTVSGITSTMVGLANVDNTMDADKPVSTATQTELDLKENTANKSTSVATDAASDVKFPSVKSVKTYVDSAINSANATNANLTGPITSSGNTTSVGSQTGTGSTFVMSASPTFTGTVAGITSTMVGLANVDNTTDLLKPVSTATLTELNLKANLASPTFTGTVSGINSTMVGLGSVDNTTDADKPVSTATQTELDLKENTANKSTNVATDAASDVKFPSVKSVKTYVDSAINSANTTNANLTGPITSSGNTTSVGTQTGTGSIFVMSASPTFTGTVSGITSTMVGLANVDNTTDLLKPVSTASQTELNLKANLASPTFTGTVSGINSTMVGLGSVDNTTDADKPVSTATLSELNSKENTANKSTSVATDAASDVKFPSVKAVKTYVDAEIADGTATNVSGIVAVANGGTGASTAADARNNLGLYSGIHSWVNDSLGASTSINTIDLAGTIDLTTTSVVTAVFRNNPGVNWVKYVQVDHNNDKITIELYSNGTIGNTISYIIIN